MRKAVNHLKKCDPVLRAIIERVGACRMEFSPAEFSSLAEAIVYQQLNGKAAVTIFRRFAALAGEPLTPAGILKLSDAQLRSVGLSKQKSAYLKDLSARPRHAPLQDVTVVRHPRPAVPATGRGRPRASLQTSPSQLSRRREQPGGQQTPGAGRGVRGLLVRADARDRGRRPEGARRRRADASALRARAPERVGWPPDREPDAERHPAVFGSAADQPKSSMSMSQRRSSGSNPAGERAIGGDESGGGAWRFQLAAEQECDGDRLLLRAGTVVSAQPVERIRAQRRQASPCIGGDCRP